MQLYHNVYISMICIESIYISKRGMMNLMLGIFSSRIKLFLVFLPIVLFSVGCSKIVEVEQAEKMIPVELSDIGRVCDDEGKVCFVYSNGYIHFEGSPDKFYGFRVYKPWCPFGDCQGKPYPDEDFYYTNEEFISVGEGSESMWFELVASDGKGKWIGPIAGAVYLSAKPVVDASKIKVSPAILNKDDEGNFFTFSDKTKTLKINLAGIVTNKKKDEVLEYGIKIIDFETGNEILSEFFKKDSFDFNIEESGTDYIIEVAARDNYQWSADATIRAFPITDDLYVFEVSKQ